MSASNPQYGRIDTPEALGALMRACRKNQNLTLERVADVSNLSMRFLSELERGKETAELGKALQALHYQPRLARFYDLVCTRAIEFIDTNLAFAVGGEYNPERLTLNHWQHLAEECHVREKYLYSLIGDMAEKLLAEFPNLQQEFEDIHGKYPALQRVEKVIFKQCNKILKVRL